MVKFAIAFVVSIRKGLEFEKGGGSVNILYIFGLRLIILVGIYIKL